MIGLEDRRVLITASASGIGLAIAHGFATAESRVYVVDVNPMTVDTVRTTASWRDRAAFSAGNVSDESFVGRLMQDQFDTFGGMEVLINCAGVKGPTGPVETLDLQDCLYRGQSGCCISVLQACHPLSSGSARWLYHQPFLDGGVAWVSLANPVCGIQRGCNRVDEVPGDGTGSPRYSGQCDLSLECEGGANGSGHSR